MALNDVLRAYELRRQVASLDPRRQMDPSSVRAPVPSAGDLPFLDEAALEALRVEAATAPPEVDAAAGVSDGSVSREAYAAALERLRMQLDADPQQLTESLLAPIRFERDAARAPPADFRFPAWKEALTPTPASYLVDSHLFETLGDLPGWLINCAQAKLHPKRNLELSTKNFRSGSAGGFRYPLVNPSPAKPLRLALFGDFGTGLVHSRYIADQLADSQVPYAFHLGDVYYAGRQREYAEYFRAPLARLVAHGKTQLFNIAGNHDQFSGNAWYWSDIDERRKVGQQQEGSFFLLHDDHFQIIGLDTNSLALEHYRDSAMRRWLVDALREGRDKKRTNILLTSEHAYDFVEPFHLLNPVGQLYRDLSEATASPGELFDAQLIDFWFWCHVHYASFNAPAPDKGFPFIGSCIGHAGYPYGRKSRPSAARAPMIRWLEEAPRFPTRLKVRPDMGNAGFVYVDLAPDRVALSYRDWMGFRRCDVELARAADGTLKVGPVNDFAEEHS